MNRIIKGVTLIELLIAVVLLSIVALGLANIDIFTHSQVISADRRAKLQHEASLALEHMTKEISKAIGNEMIDDPTVSDDGVNSVVKTQNIGGNSAVWAYIEGNPPDGKRDTVNDHWVAYRFTGASGNDRYQIRFCPQCTNNPCTQCNPAWSDNIIARNIMAFTIIKPNAGGPLNTNSVTVQVSACWDPDGDPRPCNTIDNPQVDMNTSIRMPSVSAN